MNNAQKKLAWFGALAFVGIIIISFVPTAFHVGGYDFRKVDFVADVKKQSHSDVGAGGLDGNAEADDKKKAGKNNPAGIGSTVKNDTARQPFLSYSNIINYNKASNEPVPKFVQALKDLKEGKRTTVRIAYLGDSFIEGDLITMDLRQLLQDYFGGNGVGFVPITSISAGFRQTITHSFSKDWKDFSFKSSGDRSNVFISGHNFSNGGASWVSYAAVKRPHLDSFGKAYLIYKSKEPVNISVNGAAQTLPAAPEMGSADVATGVKKLTISNIAADATLYGTSFEGETGVVVDNYSFRGISGIEMQYINPALLAQINAVHPYDLIIFQYGPNLLFKPNLSDFNFYVKPMTKAISQFQDAFPEADILVLSTGDKAFRYNGEYKTAVGVLPLLTVQNQIAKESGVNFWNLYVNMGGEGSMIKWVEGDTALANKDYTHVNFKGGRRIATLLYNTLMNAYEGKK